MRTCTFIFTEYIFNHSLGNICRTMKTIAIGFYFQESLVLEQIVKVFFRKIILKP